MTGPLAQLWTSPSWRAEASAWIERALSARGISVTGPVEQPRVQFWSTQLTAQTSAGLVWFKENNPGQAFEGALMAALADVAPQYVVEPLAVDPERGWFLASDHGSTLGALESTDQQVWARVVGDFARLQRRTIGHRDRLLATGLPELDPHACLAFVAESLSELASLPTPIRGT